MPREGTKATSDDDDHQSVGSTRWRRLKTSAVGAGDRVSCDSGISLEDPVLPQAAASPALVRREKKRCAGDGAGGGAASYVRRLTQLFETLSHDELRKEQARQEVDEEEEEEKQDHHHHQSARALHKPVTMGWELNKVTEESGSVPASPEVCDDQPPSVLQIVDGDVSAGDDRNESEIVRESVREEVQDADVPPGQVDEPASETVNQLVAPRSMASSGTVVSTEDRMMAMSARLSKGSSGAKKRLGSRRSQVLLGMESGAATTRTSVGATRRSLHHHQHQQHPGYDKIHEEYGYIYDDDDDEFDTSEDEPEEEGAASGVEFGEEACPPGADQQPISEAHNIHVPVVDAGMPHYEEHDEFSSSSFDSDSEGEFFAGRPDSNSSLKTARVTSILQELLENEANYVQTLGRGIENYVSIMSGKDLPPGLRGQKFHIFGNIEKIHSLHQNQLLPALQRNRASIQGIAETFIWFLENDKFYSYIMFALNRPKSERICNRNLDFFQRRQAEVDDKLGLNSFLLQPIQRLPRYKLLLAEINKEILKQLEDTVLQSVREEIGVLCKAEKRLERFIDIVNEAMSINDIHECYEGVSCVQTELMNAINVFNLVVDAPMVLILRPHTDFNPDKREPINLFNQGKFRKMFEVDIYDWDHRRRYAAKLFVFERSVIYSEKIKNELEYRGRYDESEIGLHNERSNKVYLYAKKRGIQEIEVTCGDMNETQRLSGLIEHMMREFAVNERWRLKTLDRPRIPSVMTLNRRSVNSMTSNSSSLSIMRESLEPISQTTWSTDKPVAQLATMQKNFCRILAANRRYYFSDLPQELARKVSVFALVYDRIVNVHVKRLYEDLAKPDTGIDEVCELFIGYLKEGTFDDYYGYIRHFKPAAKIMKNVHKATRSSISDSMVAQTMDEFTFLPIEHWNKLQHFFQALVVQISEQMNKGEMENQELFRKLAYVEVQVTSFRKLLFQNYQLFNLDETITPAVLGLVVYSDRVRYDNETISSHRVLLCERAVVCLKFHFVRECGRQAEKYTGFAFIDRFGRESNIKVSKKSEIRLNALLNDTKHAFDFGNTANRDKFYGQYCTVFARFS
uniref:DH domain-containing protein n=1 Tax=Anopheles atroparvus TaxID=41427 RepID=A0AAG5DKR4_ANOAO